MTRGLLVLVASYAIGGIPTGLILYRLARGGDIREVGSGNIGATNVARSGGYGIGVLTLVLDAAKGAAAVLMARAATGEMSWAAAAAFAAVAGHCFPVWLGFRGGKGVATGCGAFSLLHPAAMGVALAVFLLVVASTRLVSAGSVLAALAFPAGTALLGAGTVVSLFSAATGIVIVGRHHENLKRIFSGDEPRLGAARSERRR